MRGAEVEARCEGEGGAGAKRIGEVVTREVDAPEKAKRGSRGIMVGATGRRWGQCNRRRGVEAAWRCVAECLDES